MAPAEGAPAIDPAEAEQPSAFDHALEAELGESAEAEPAETEAAGDQPARRRRSRGGRRRRSEGEAREPAPEAAPEGAPAPSYEQVYTPPAYNPPVYNDIADIFEAAERAEAEARERRERARQAPPTVTAPPELAPVYEGTDPAEPAVAVAEPALAEPVGEAAAAAPLVKPVVIGDAEPGAEKKRGWWRR